MGECSKKPPAAVCPGARGPREDQGIGLAGRQAYLGLSTLEGLTPGKGRENFHRKEESKLSEQMNG